MKDAMIIALFAAQAGLVLWLAYRWEISRIGKKR